MSKRSSEAAEKHQRCDLRMARAERSIFRLSRNIMILGMPRVSPFVKENDDEYI